MKHKKSFTYYISTLERRAEFLNKRIAAAPPNFDCGFDKAEWGALIFALKWLYVLRDQERARAASRRLTTDNTDGAENISERDATNVSRPSGVRDETQQQ
jgi:hypothetical protein